MMRVGAAPKCSTESVSLPRGRNRLEKLFESGSWVCQTLKVCPNAPRPFARVFVKTFPVAISELDPEREDPNEFTQVERPLLKQLVTWCVQEESHLQ